jgi:hypothetical protein
MTANVIATSFDGSSGDEPEGGGEYSHAACKPVMPYYSPSSAHWVQNWVQTLPDEE